MNRAPTIGGYTRCFPPGTLLKTAAIQLPVTFSVENGWGRLPVREISVKKTLVVLGLLVCAMSAVQAQKLTGAGATFPEPIYGKWFSEYSAAHPGVEINYQAIGSGGGVRQMTAGLVDFGASDMPVTDEQLAASKIKLTHIPTVMGAVVPSFNVPGVNDIKFDPTVLADIYLGKISNWNDGR